MAPPSADKPSHAPENQRPSEALRETFAQYQAELLGMLYFLAGGEELARQALQEAFSKCWRHRHGAVEKISLKSWVFRVAMSLARDMRHAAKHRPRPLEETEAAQLTDSASPPDDPQQRARLIRLRRTISQLHSRQREILLLRQNGGLSYEGIAQSVNLPVATVKTRMRLVLVKLREALEGPRA